MYQKTLALVSVILMSVIAGFARLVPFTTELKSENAPLELTARTL